MIIIMPIIDIDITIEIEKEGQEQEEKQKCDQYAIVVIYPEYRGALCFLLFFQKRLVELLHR